MRPAKKPAPHPPTNPPARPPWTQVRAEVGDPHRDAGYWGTSRMLLEAALCLALEQDKLVRAAGLRTHGAGSRWLPAPRRGGPQLDWAPTTAQAPAAAPAAPA